jgi:hypothetical protein
MIPMSASEDKSMDLTMQMMNGLFDGALLVNQQGDVLHINKNFPRVMAYNARDLKK